MEGVGIEYKCRLKGVGWYQKFIYWFNLIFLVTKGCMQNFRTRITMSGRKVKFTVGGYLKSVLAAFSFFFLTEGLMQNFRTLAKPYL
jgi:hypothetical protein